MEIPSLLHAAENWSNPSELAVALFTLADDDNQVAMLKAALLEIGIHVTSTEIKQALILPAIWDILKMIGNDIAYLIRTGGNDALISWTAFHFRNTDPRLSVAPSFLRYENTDSVAVSVSNIGGGDLNWEVAEDMPPWVVFDPLTDVSEGFITSGEQ